MEVENLEFLLHMLLSSLQSPHRLLEQRLGQRRRRRLSSLEVLIHPVTLDAPLDYSGSSEYSATQDPNVVDDPQLS